MLFNDNLKQGRKDSPTQGLSKGDNYILQLRIDLYCSIFHELNNNKFGILICSCYTPFQFEQHSSSLFY